ncbi:hypothetical protein NP493_1104g04003 [Ridgeia piscesae]|uniref:Uncharacterized protein n=1 Tax=Ridgeia piscesae TaxID=27915 RepID=A0AAD9NI27_RIDPI|nr:hypothetical protein NP493_1104g04003 [Ridgeia piscesae]
MDLWNLTKQNVGLDLGVGDISLSDAAFAKILLDSIVSTVVVDKREVKLRSPNMEKLALEESEPAVRNSADCRALVVDKREVKLRSPNMEKLALEESEPAVRHSADCRARDEYPQICHQWDIWHAAKNLGKKLSEVSSNRANKALAPWCGDIVKHFWHCAKTAGGSVERFKNKPNHGTYRSTTNCGISEASPFPDDQGWTVTLAGSPGNLCTGQAVRAGESVTDSADDTAWDDSANICAMPPQHKVTICSMTKACCVIFWKKIFFNLMDMALLNSYELYHSNTDDTRPAIISSARCSRVSVA